MPISITNVLNPKGYRYLGKDSSHTTIGNSITATKIGEVIIPGYSISSYLCVFASVLFANGPNLFGSTFDLYVGNNANFATNTKIDTIQLGYGSSGHDILSAGDIIAMVAPADYGGNLTTSVYVQLVATNTTADADTISKCQTLLVMGE